jgi:hypothetical protein
MGDIGFDPIQEIMSLKTRISVLEEESRARRVQDERPMPMFFTWQDLGICCGMAAGAVRQRAIEFGLYDPASAPRGRGNRSGLSERDAAEFCNRIFPGREDLFKRAIDNMARRTKSPASA